MAYLWACLICQQDKIDHQLLAKLLEPNPLASRPWESVTMDSISALPKFEWCRSIMAVVDCYRKCAIFIVTWAIAKWTKLPTFSSSMLWSCGGFWRVLWATEIHYSLDAFEQSSWSCCKLTSSSQQASTQTDRQTEGINNILEMYLRHYVSAHQQD